MNNSNNNSNLNLRILSYVALLISAAWLGSVIFLFEKSILPTTTFVGMIASFLGLDVAKILKSTYHAPKNQFKKIRKFRYMFCLLLILALYITCLLVKDKQDIVDTANMLTNGAFVIIALFLGGIGGNKILTSSDNKNDKLSKKK